MPPPTEPAESLFMSSDLDDEDADWRPTFGGDDGVPATEHIIQQRQSELDRFMHDALDLACKRVVNGRIVTTSMKDEPLRWWRKRGEHLYPTLARMAYNLFAFPGMSSECERAFNSTLQLVTDDRYNLKQDIIEADQRLKS
jgi:hypothetical protein